MALTEFCVCDRDQESVRTKFNITGEEVARKLRLLQEWVGSNPRLPPDSKDEDFLRIMLLRGKFKDAVVRRNIENHFNFIKRHPEMFNELATLRQRTSSGIAVVTRRPTCSWERIGILKLNVDYLKKGSFSFKECYLIGLTTAMLMFAKDYSVAVRLVLDMEGFRLKHILKINILDLHKLLKLHENVLKMRIAGIEVINANNLIGFILKLAKLVLPPKIFSRLTVHEDLLSLYKNIPKECLPSDYGGESASIEELMENWDEIYETEQEFFRKIQNLSNQNLETF